MGERPVDPVQVALGRAVRELREGRRLRQEEVAAEAGVHVTYLSGVERGRRNPTWDVIVRLAAALGKKPSQLVARAEKHLPGE